MKRGWIGLMAVGLAGWVCAQGLSGTDRIELRDGSQLEGQFLAEARTGWQFRERNGSLHTVAPDSGRLVHFADPERSRRFYGISPISTAERNDVVLLPTESFGEDLLEGLRGAEKSIHILAYNLSNWGTAPMADIFETLKNENRVAAGVGLPGDVGCQSGASSGIRMRTAGARV